MFDVAFSLGHSNKIICGECPLSRDIETQYYFKIQMDIEQASRIWVGKQ